MDDFAKKLIVLVLLVAFFGALFLEAPILYSQIKSGEIKTPSFLRFSDARPVSSNGTNSNSKIQNSKTPKKEDYSKASPINVPALDNPSMQGFQYQNPPSSQNTLGVSPSQNPLVYQ